MKPTLTSASTFVLQTVLVASVLLPAVIQAQVPPDIPPPGDTTYEVRLADGSVIIARIAEVDEERVVLTTPGGGRLEIGRDQIREIRPVRGRIVDGELWHEDPSTTRLLFTATGRALGQGEAYVGTYVVVLPFAAVGITERFATEIGIVAAVSDGDADCCIPLVNFSYAFGRK